MPRLPRTLVGWGLARLVRIVLGRELAHVPHVAAIILGEPIFGELDLVSVHELSIVHDDDVDAVDYLFLSGDLEEVNQPLLAILVDVGRARPEWIQWVIDVRAVTKDCGLEIRNGARYDQGFLPFWTARLLLPV